MIDTFINIFWLVAEQFVALVVPVISIVIIFKILQIFILGKGL